MTRPHQADAASADPDVRVPWPGGVPSMTLTPIRPAVPAAPDPAAAPLLPVVGRDLRVPLVTGGEARYVNLDYAASAPALETVAARGAEVLPYYASVHRGAGYA